MSIIIGASRRVRREMPMDIGGALGGIFGGGDNSARRASDAQLQGVRESNDLLREFNQQARQDNEPWRQAGQQGLNALLYRLGLGGSATGAPGGSMLTEAQIREQLLPQFTTSTGNQNAGTPGEVPRNLTGARNLAWGYDPGSSQWGWSWDQEMGGDAGGVNRRFQAASPGSQTATSIDESGLSAAIQQRLAQQQQQAATQSQANAADPNFGSLLRGFTQADFQVDPGYQFRLEQGQDEIRRAAASAGGLNSGRALKDLTAYNSGMASQEFNNAYNRWNSDNTNTYNRLAGLAGVGQTAAAQNIQGSQQLGQQLASNAIQAGNARASGYMGQANASNQGLNNLLGVAGTAANLWTAFSDRRLKTNIRRIGTHPSGLPWYEFDYVWGEHAQGVMADEAQHVRPAAVSTHASGYQVVNYGAL